MASARAASFSSTLDPSPASSIATGWPGAVAGTSPTCRSAQGDQIVPPTQAVCEALPQGHRRRNYPAKGSLRRHLNTTGPGRLQEPLLTWLMGVLDFPQKAILHGLAEKSPFLLCLAQIFSYALQSVGSISTSPGPCLSAGACT